MIEEEQCDASFLEEVEGRWNGPRNGIDAYTFPRLLSLAKQSISLQTELDECKDEYRRFRDLVAQEKISLENAVAFYADKLKKDCPICGKPLRCSITHHEHEHI